MIRFTYNTDYTTFAITKATQEVSRAERKNILNSESH